MILLRGPCDGPPYLGRYPSRGPYPECISHHLPPEELALLPPIGNIYQEASASTTMSDQSLFKKLPPELLIMIAKELSVPGLKTFRLLSKLSKDIADPLLFHTITFSTQERHISQFLTISQHPQHRLYVKQLNYSVTSLITPNRKSFSSLLKASKYNLALEQEEQLYDDMAEKVAKAENMPVWQVIDILYFGFSRLSNLRSIAFVHDLVGRSGWFQEFPFLSSAYERHHFARQGFRLFWRTHTIMDGHVHWTDLYAIAYAARSSGAKINRLSDYESSEEGVIDLQRTPIMRTGYELVHIEDISPYETFFSNLSELSLNVDSFNCSLRPLPEFLSAATSLEVLNLDFQSRGSIPPISLNADPFLSAFRLRHSCKKQADYYPGTNVFLPKLRSLTLTNFTVDEGELSSFFKHHRTLEHLVLRNVYHKPSHESPKAWEDLLDTIKSMNLNSVILENVSGFLRDMNHLATGCWSTGSTGLNVKQIIHIDDCHARRLWSGINLWTGKMPVDIRKKELKDARVEINEWRLVESVRDRIKRDRDNLDPLIMEYIKGTLGLNPLVGLAIHEQIDWAHDELFARVLSSDG